MRSSRRPARDSASGVVDACGPKSPDSHRAVWGLISRPPVSPAGFSPVSRLPAGFLPFVRLPLVSLRPAFSGSFPSAVARFRFPSVSLRVPVPLGNLHVSAAAGRFRRRRSQAAGTKVTSSAATTSPGSRDPPAFRWAAAGHDGIPADYALGQARFVSGPMTRRISGSANGLLNLWGTDNDDRDEADRCTDPCERSCGEASSRMAASDGNPDLCRPGADWNPTFPRPVIAEFLLDRLTGSYRESHSNYRGRQPGRCPAAGRQ